MHAAQIYAEMLGQVCRKGLYIVNPEGFQEVSPLYNLYLHTVLRHPCKTCNILPLLCQISKHVSTGYLYLWRQIQNLRNHSYRNCHSPIEAFSHATPKTTGGVLQASFNSI